MTDYPTAPLPAAAHSAMARIERALTTPTPPNPAAAAAYTLAATYYDQAARDADRLGAHTRAATYRTHAQQHRALATQMGGGR